ncbi:MAG: transposase [Gammaproteobacteria bacterium]|nr:transposase [Gammaproteobacteria bacterium]
MGLTLSLVVLCEIHDINRFHRVLDFASYSRLVKYRHASAGKT